ncbi:MAG: DNA replication and repair protein RecF [Trueperaceae bacterium]|nr:DNA replication and repair protein RecF [Trueperaceae bacterium]
MLLRSLSQINFRNMQTPRLEFGPGITAIVGKNAAGKSNLLDAIYLACTGDLPGGKIVESVRIGETEGFVSSKVERQDGIATIEVGLAPGRKVLRLDGQSVRSNDIARVSSAVLITPEDADLVHGSPSGRRTYLDTLLSKLSLRYALLLREYGRVVEQRNAALKASYEDLTLPIWTEKFLELGKEIEAVRIRAMRRISEIAEVTYREIASDNKVLGVVLESQSEADLSQRLDRTRQEERARGVTVVGPHRDELLLSLNGHSVQAYGSRGEARTTSLALRVAEYQLLREKHGEAPILLLDDFTAELDANRRSYLLSLAANTPQAIITGTETPPQYDALYHVAGGSFSGTQ